MSDDFKLNIGCFGWICAFIAFVSIWFSAIAAFNFFGFIFGWLPALIVAVLVAVCADIALWLMWCILVFALLVAGALLLFGASLLSLISQ